ncbi:MAG: PIN domain-containing protein [Moraxella sp.]|nr:PIN domain-containing protein [Moraxella sp.]
MVSKIALLDVNILVALFDAKHQHRSLVKNWLGSWIKAGHQWATCPITQNGCLRILSLPNYKNGFKLIEIKNHLGNAVAGHSHVFIPDNISLLQDNLINWRHIQGSRQLTDAYLLALAKHNDAVFVSLDGRIATYTAVGIDEQDFICLD